MVESQNHHPTGAILISQARGPDLSHPLTERHALSIDLSGHQVLMAHGPPSQRRVETGIGGVRLFVAFRPGMGPLAAIGSIVRRACKLKATILPLQRIERNT